MAQVHYRRENLYSQKQSIRDELSAPQYLESAGDELIRSLAKKQLNTSISLQEQLETVQNFEKGFELNPDNRKGISSLRDFKKHAFTEEKPCSSVINESKIKNADQLMKVTGLSRHEIELNLCEKPKSIISQLYMFAIKNKRKKNTQEPLETKLPDHPINHLKEIEEECFGHKKALENYLNFGVGQRVLMETRLKKKKKHRKRKKKTQGNSADNILKNLSLESEPLRNPIHFKDEEPLKALPSRVSLWDVKDMKKWSASEQIGCKPQAFYTIKNGKIIKLEKESGGKDTTRA